MYKYLLFDLDGTLTDSQEGITKSVSYALINLGVEDLPEDIKLRFIGPPLKDSFPKYCGFDEETTEKAIALYRERYSKVGKFENRPYEGIPELLKKLKDDNRVLVIASSKPTGFVEDILNKFDLRQYFDIISAADLSGKKCEKEDVIKEALEILNLKNGDKDVVMIGDRHYDINGAKYFNLDSIGVNYGFAFDKNELKDAGATYVVETVEELGELLFS
ncbi:MAG: HAD hydrolase-like protein [Lachnospiraceae bacterium]|nr:HAD hydrolase-like protein [Lachnospiraceae bacterium]